VIKAVGGGLSINLASFSVLPVGNQLRGVRNLGRDTTLDGWTVASLEADAGYRVAVSVRGSDWEIVRV
jgi:hypothetical protein